MEFGWSFFGVLASLLQASKIAKRVRLEFFWSFVRSNLFFSTFEVFLEFEVGVLLEFVFSMHFTVRLRLAREFKPKAVFWTSRSGPPCRQSNTHKEHGHHSEHASEQYS